MEIETTSMARRRLLMNYEWFPELLSQLPDAVKTDHYCRKLLLHLANLADYMCNVGPWKMSKKRLSQVLATFRPWELRSPDIEAAVQVLYLSCLSNNEESRTIVDYIITPDQVWEIVLSSEAILIQHN